MATFEAKVYKLIIEPHPNADKLELARVGDYRAIVQKGQYKTGDLGVYIPEQAVLPEQLIEEMNLVGRLAGNQKNRVKAIKLRGVLSQGLIYPLEKHPDYDNVWRVSVNGVGGGQLVELGQDVTKHLDIIKYEPPVPVHMAGEVYNAGRDILFGYDIENFKRYPNVFEDGQVVYFSEKLHGSYMMFVHLPSRLHDDRFYKDRYIIASKGLAAQGLALKHNEANAKNVYLRAAEQYQLYDKFELVTGANNDAIYVLGEVYGKGIQDLQYGVPDSKIGFRIFDVRIGRRWLDPMNLQTFCHSHGLETVPFLYRGPFSKEVMEQYTSGKESISGKELHMREGIVIRPAMEREDEELGRVILKSVSEQYLLRKKGTEFN